ncbi:alanine-tRNA ligases [Striga asiatica]|uniref:Alanine-tRNA ligases n=1 Tax=Striga asiatica TaxID=4170 RepID=A0A5A7QWP1_STRAF|nr:alanine-tRNA ligases [Striga asiatica]
MVQRLNWRVGPGSGRSGGVGLGIHRAGFDSGQTGWFGLGSSWARIGLCKNGLRGRRNRGTYRLKRGSSRRRWGGVECRRRCLTELGVKSDNFRLGSDGRFLRGFRAQTGVDGGDGKSNWIA